MECFSKMNGGCPYCRCSPLSLHPKLNQSMSHVSLLPIVVSVNVEQDHDSGVQQVIQDTQDNTQVSIVDVD